VVAFNPVCNNYVWCLIRALFYFHFVNELVILRHNSSNHEQASCLIIAGNVCVDHYFVGSKGWEDESETQRLVPHEGS
jgi:hypothetical protein